MAKETTTSTSHVVRNFKDRADAPELKSAILEALTKGVGEVHCIVERDGHSHFTSFGIDQLFEVMKKSAVHMAGSMNRAIKKSSASKTTRTNAKIGEV